MKCAERPLAITCLLVAAFMCLSIGTVNAREVNLGAGELAAAQTTKQQCINSCRARYRDCRRLNQTPSFECRSVYHDCVRYTCAGLGPG